MLPRLMISVAIVSAIVLGDLQRIRELRFAELSVIDGLFRFLPWIGVGIHRLLDLRVQVRADPEAVFDENLPQRVDAHAFEETVGALQILAVFAVVLDEAAHVEKYFVVSVNGAEQVALSYGAAGRAADIDFPPAAFDGHRSEVLYVRLGTVSRTSGGGELHLVRRLDALEAPLDLPGQRDGIAHSIPAEVRADAALAGAKRL